MKAKIMLIGGGGREDAIARKIIENEGTLISILPFENPSIIRMSEKYFIAGENDADKIISLAKAENPDVVYVSPDSFLDKPIVDALQYSKIKVASPDTKAFQIESSKIFMRQLIKRFGISGNIKYDIFYDESMLCEGLCPQGKSVYQLYLHQKEPCSLFLQDQPFFH